MIMEGPADAILLKGDEKTLRLKAGSTVGLRSDKIGEDRTILEQAIVDVDGAAVEVFEFSSGRESWAGLKAVKVGKFTARIYVLEPKSEAYLVKVIEGVVE